MSSQKGLTLPVIILIIVILIVMAGIYYLVQYKNSTFSPPANFYSFQTTQNSPTSLPSSLSMQNLIPKYIGNYDLDIKISSDNPCKTDKNTSWL